MGRHDDVLEGVYNKYPGLRPLMGTNPDFEEAWYATFREEPDVMYNIFANIIKQEYAKPGRVGQRPMPHEKDVDVEALLYGSSNTRPMSEVLPELMGCSIREFAKKVNMSHTQVHRTMQGEYHPDASQIRRIAAALGKSPAFFVEYRKMMLVSALVRLIEERPDIATTLFARFVQASSMRRMAAV